MENDKILKEWAEKLPIELNQFYDYLSDAVQKVNTFDLLSCISFYNAIHNIEEYTDYRGDKAYFISEVLSLLCLKNSFVKNTIIPKEEFFDFLKEIQDKISNYCGRKDAIDAHNRNREDNIFADISQTLVNEAKRVRNPGHPEHHYIFSKKLFNPIQNELKILLGFSIEDSLIIRQGFPYFINQKYADAIENIKEKANSITSEIFRYKTSNQFYLSKDELEQCSSFSKKEIKDFIHNKLIIDLWYSFHKVYTFTKEEIANYFSLDINSVEAFLNLFSCKFPSLGKDDEIYAPITILKTKPIIEHRGRYLIPSFPLFIWAIEEVIESIIKDQPKLIKKYPTIKHDFLLNQGLEYFKALLPSATIHKPNLYYTINNERYETDGLIIYDKVLFIIEAKGNRITQKAKSGHQLKTKDHLKDIIRASYEQGIRTLKYIEDNKSVEFKTEQGEKIIINRDHFDDIVITSLTLDPIGNIAMHIRATNEIDYFNSGHFPWIISLYDLVSLADFIENPIMFIHYLKRRKKFLSYSLLSSYEELDLLAYFLNNGLFINDLLDDAKRDNISGILFDNNTDIFNDYYMYKFGPKTKYTPKPNLYISTELQNFLLQLDKSKLPHRVKMALILLEFNNESIKQLMDRIKKIKKDFAKDRNLHDCSVYTESYKGIGITFMIAENKDKLDYKLYQYCNYKINQLNANVWIGFGDISTNKNIFDFKSMFFYMKEEVIF